MKFSKIEIKHLLYSWVLISLIVASAEILDVGNLWYSLIFAALTVGIGFLVHEIAHKYVAQKYGCFAEYRADFQMLIMAFVFAVFAKFVFIAPGAVMMSGNITKEKNGKISLAGPLSNLMLSVIFFMIMKFLDFSSSLVEFSTSTGFIQALFYYAFFVNAFLALFNLIPVGNFDGSKILRWNKPVYAVMVVAALGLTFCAYLI